MLQGKKVEHATFGTGRIIGESGDTVSVNFLGARGRGVTRRFLRQALFDDTVFPRAQNAEIWAERGK